MQMADAESLRATVKLYRSAQVTDSVAAFTLLASSGLKRAKNSERSGSVVQSDARRERDAATLEATQRGRPRRVPTPGEDVCIKEPVFPRTTSSYIQLHPDLELRPCLHSTSYVSTAINSEADARLAGAASL